MSTPGIKKLTKFIGWNRQSKTASTLAPSNMTGITFKGPQFVYQKDDRTGDAVIYCTRPIQFKAYVFMAPDNPKGFKLLPEKDTEQIRKIMKRMDDWYFKLHSLEQ